MPRTLGTRLVVSLCKVVFCNVSRNVRTYPVLCLLCTYQCCDKVIHHFFYLGRAKLLAEVKNMATLQSFTHDSELALIPEIFPSPSSLYVHV